MTEWLGTLRAFVQLSRPHFLLGGFLMYALGAAAAPGIELMPYLMGQLMVTAAQITAHYVNEYADLEPDRAVGRRTWFSGGSGVLVAGRLSPVVAMRAALISSALTIVAAVTLSLTAPDAALLGMGSLAVSWAYSMPPVRLLATGWGELATSLVVTVAVPLIGLLSQQGSIGTELWWGLAPLLMIHVGMMLAFGLPDLPTDAASAKRVLAVRMGIDQTVRAIVLLYLGAFAVAAGGVAVGELGATAALGAGLVLLAAPIVPAAVRSARWALLTTSAVAALVVAGLGTLAAWV